MAKMNPSAALARRASRNVHSLKMVCAFLVSFASVPSVTFAATDPAAICENVAVTVARETGVPYDVLLALSLTETAKKVQGRVRPWAWTVNMEGKGVWFDDFDEAYAYVKKEFDRGARSFDVGCFQLNYKWHHQGFSSIEHMFDPLENGRYAARFLKSLYAEKGNWLDAAAAYHSRTPQYAEIYKARFHKFLTKQSGRKAPEIQLAMADIPKTTSVGPDAPRENNFPFFVQNSGGQTLGSLVPLNVQARPSLWAQNEVSR